MCGLRLYLSCGEIWVNSRQRMLWSVMKNSQRRLQIKNASECGAHCGKCFHVIRSVLHKLLSWTSCQNERKKSLFKYFMKYCATYFHGSFFFRLIKWRDSGERVSDKGIINLHNLDLHDLAIIRTDSFTHGGRRTKKETSPQNHPSDRRQWKIITQHTNMAN